MVIALGVPSLYGEGMQRCVYLYLIGVGFCVARFTMMGNAKASECETSDKYRFLRLFFFMPHPIIIYVTGLSGESWADCYWIMKTRL